MKKLISILLIIALILTLSACNDVNNTSSDLDIGSSPSDADVSSSQPDEDVSSLRSDLESSSEDVTSSEAHIHSYSSTVISPTCKEQGWTKFTCDCGHTYNGDFLSARHTEVIDPAIPGSKFVPGQSEGKHCSVCGEVLVARKTVSRTEDSDGNSTFKLVNSLDEEYEYKLGSTLYSKCKIENFFCSISGSGDGNVRLHINFDVIKTAEGETENKDILFYLFLFRDGKQIDGAMMRQPDTELGATYNMRYNELSLPEGNYTMMFKSAYSL